MEVLPEALGVLASDADAQEVVGYAVFGEIACAALHAEGEHETGTGQRGPGAVVLWVRAEAGVADLMYFGVLAQALRKHRGVRLGAFKAQGQGSKPAQA